MRRTEADRRATFHHQAPPRYRAASQRAAARRSFTKTYTFTFSLTMSAVLGRTEVYSLLSLSLACFGILANTLQGDGEPLIASIAFSGLAFAFCYALIRWLGNAFMRRGFKGKDLCKLKQTEMYACQCNFPTCPVCSHDAARRPWAPFVLWFISLLLSCLFPGPSTRISLQQHLAAVIVM